MRKCKYCGMPMEDDDLFCTRCGKEAPGQRAEAAKDKENAASGQKIRRGMMYGDPQRDDLDEGDEGGRRVDTVTVLLLAAAAVLLVVLGSLVFRIAGAAGRGRENTAGNEIAVYDKEQDEEQNLNQGLQTPSSGQPADPAEEEPDVRVEIPAEEPQTAEPQPAPAPAQEQVTEPAREEEPGDAQEAEEAEEPEEPEEEYEEEYDEEAYDEEAYDEEDYVEEEYAEEDSEDDEYGWVIDEEGNEVYYPREGEEYDFDDQTGGIGMQSAPETRTAAAQPETEKTSVPGTSALAGTAAPDTSDYILSESNSRYYTEEELKGLDDDTLQMAINEIYARHGRRFNTESMQEYFDGKDWYSGTIDPVEFDGNEALYFNEYEVSNRELMSRLRAERQQASAVNGQ